MNSLFSNESVINILVGFGLIFVSSSMAACAYYANDLLAFVIPASLCLFTAFAGLWVILEGAADLLANYRERG